MKRNLIVILCLVLLTTLVNAQTTFQKVYESSNIITGARALKKTMDKGYIIAGMAQDSLNTRYALLLKLDSSTNVLWSKTFFCIGDADAFDIVQTDDNGFVILCNRLQGPSNITFLIRTDSIGDTLWTKAYGGGQDHVHGHSIIQTIDKGFLITADRKITFSANGIDIYIFKIDSIGNPVWSKTYGSGFPNSDDVGTRSIQLNDGSFLVLGQCNFALGSVGYLLIKINSSGNTLWIKKIITPNIDIPLYFEQTNDGGYIIAGEIEAMGGYDVHLVKTDSIGNVEWSKIYSGGIYEVPNEVHQTSDNGYVVIGYSYSWNLTSTFLIKTDINGNSEWTKGYGDGSTVYAAGYSVLEAGAGGYLLAGWFSYPLTYSNVHLIKTDTIGNSGCYEQNHPFTVSIPITQSNATSANTSSGIIVDSFSVVINTPLLQVTTLCPLNVDEITFENYSVYPNPFASAITINIQKLNVKRTSLIIKNLLGQIIFTKQENDHNSTYTKTIDLSFLSKGIYLLEVTIDGERTVKKIMKE